MIVIIKSKKLGERHMFLDEEDWDKIKDYKLCLSRESKGSSNELVYVVGFIPPRKKGVHLVRVHRLIIGAEQGQFVDHINGNSLDNRKENLRIASRADNMQNTRKRANGSSVFKGVDYKKRQKCWRARLYINGKQYNLGNYGTEIEAAEAYNKAVVAKGSKSPLNRVKIK